MDVSEQRFITRMWSRHRRLLRWTAACAALGFIPHYLWIEHDGAVP